MNLSRMKTGLCALSVALVMLVVGCGNAAQQTAYEHAATLEQHLSDENAPAIIAEYQNVVRLKPGSKWAKKAQERIDAIQAKLRADELHKSVFHETGID